jgi:hypothetical protein
MKSTASNGNLFISYDSFQGSFWFSELAEFISTGIHCCYYRKTSKSTFYLLSPHFQGDQSASKAMQKLSKQASLYGSMLTNKKIK